MPRRSERGFTLMEVMISLAILSIALVAILDMHSGGLRTHDYARKLTQATLLARGKMVELEDEAYQKDFSELGEVRTGTFEEEGAPKFKWEAQLLKPAADIDIQKIFALISQVSGDHDDSPETGGADPMQAMGPLFQPILAAVNPVIKEGFRELRLTVRWSDMTGPSELTVVTHILKVPGMPAPGSAEENAQLEAQQRVEALREAGAQPGNLPNLLPGGRPGAPLNLRPAFPPGSIP